VKIRAVTLGLDLPTPADPTEPLRRAASFLGGARAAFGAAGIDVQTVRVAGQALDEVCARLSVADLQAAARGVEAAARAAGIDFLSLGRIPANRPDVVRQAVASILAGGELVFLSADLVDRGRPSPAMAAACACAVKELAVATDQGFGNLRFAATAGCPPNIPFFPAAYHAGGPPRFAVAVEAADVVLGALRGPGGLQEIEDRLAETLEQTAGPIERVATNLSRESGYPFVGIDLSPAPFPTDAISIGAAIEAVGVDRFGAPGTLYVAALITRAIRRTRLRRTGFSGLMLPVLEDSVLAQRTAERPAGLSELLLYSAVCGTGLDTVPLPGDVSEAELAGVFLDVAALSVALDGKPLTVRLMPVPGAVAGSTTAFSFAYFANTRVLPGPAGGAAGILARGGYG